MNRSLPYILAIGFVIGVGSILQYKYCCFDGVTSGREDIELPENNQGMPLTIQAPAGDFLISSPSNFNFPFSSYSFITPLDSGLVIELERLSKYMQNHEEDAILNITGYNYNQEDNLSAFPTLGEARANAVKSTLIERGASGTQLNVSGASAGNWQNSDTIVYGPIVMEIISPPKIEIQESETTVAEEEAEMEAFVNEINSEPMVLHFETGKSHVVLNADERKQISKLNNFIDQSQQSKILIVGHADNSGNPEMNMKLGKDRAEFLKSYLVRNGFQSSRIETRTQGDLEPIANNSTENGRRENRRAVMTLIDK